MIKINIKNIFIILIYIIFLINAVSAVKFEVYPNTIISSTFEVVPADIISLSYISQFPIELEQKNFSNQTSLTEIKYRILVPYYTPSGWYNDSKIIVLKKKEIMINDTVVVGNTTITYNLSKTILVEKDILDIDIFVKKYYNFTLNYSSEEFKTCSDGLYEINIKNLGNEVLYPNITIPQNSIFLVKDIFLPPILPRVEYPVFLFYSIPCNHSTGKFSINLTINNKIFTINYNITDKNPPEISIDVDRLNYTYGESAKVCWNITDYQVVKDCYLVFLNKTYSIKEKGCKEFFISDIGDLTLQIFASDFYGNKNNNSIKIHSKRIGVSDLNKNIKILKTKPNIAISQKIFTISQPTKVRIVVDKVRYLGDNTTRDIDVRLDSDKESLSLKYGTNDTLLVGGDVKLTISGSREGKYEGDFKIIFPSFTNTSTERFHFTGSIGKYRVTEASNFILWDKKINCTPYDTDYYSTSKLICCSEYPIDVDLDELVIPVSKKEEKLIEERWRTELEKTKGDLEGKINLRNWIIYIETFVIISYTIAIILFIFVLPGIRVRF
ncbi:MAG: hypothetical protein ACTSX6_03300 [Candidatus Heimdallarchaeaceae archaeon]